MTILFLALTLLSACGTLTVTDVTPQDAAQLHADRDADLDTEVERLVKPMVDTGYTPGVIAGVLLPDGSMHFYGYGVADQDTKAPMTPDTLIPVGSLSKGSLAAMTAEFVAEGKLHWDDTLPQMLPPGTQLSDDAQKITLFQLATHTAGLPRQPLTPQTLAYFVEYLFDGESFYPHITRDYILDYLKTFEAEDPGTIRYSNIGYGLIAYILQLKSGLTIDQLLQQRITGPLRLTCTGYDREALPCNAMRAHGYAGDSPWFIPRGDTTPDWDFTPYMRGAAALHSTPHDILTFARAHLHGDAPFNRILAGNLKQCVTDPSGDGIGIGWTIDQVDGEPINYEIGLVAGYTSYLGVDRARKTAVVLMQNSFNWDSSVGHKLLVWLRKYPVIAPEAAPPSQKPDDRPVQKRHSAPHSN